MTSYLLSGWDFHHCRSFEVVVAVLLSARGRDAVSRWLNQDNPHLLPLPLYPAVMMARQVCLRHVFCLLIHTTPDETQHSSYLQSCSGQSLHSNCQCQDKRNRAWILLRCNFATSFLLSMFNPPTLAPAAPLPLISSRCSVSPSSLHCQSLGKALASELAVPL